ncbi:putative nuclease HARBI1 [Watersipora subatra]|uniref:putative nuclease HARBI1 n=1 Tax=Watersipora subatra TaxID=2589382 RepID=UPI00355B95E4
MSKEKKVHAGTYCVVPGCYNASKKDPHLKFHRFPWNQERCKKWIISIGRKDNHSNNLFKPNNNHRVCSAHFVDGTKSEAHPIPTIFPLKQKPTKTRVPNKLSQVKEAARTAEEKAKFTAPEPISFEEVFTNESVRSTTQIDCETSYKPGPDHTYSKPPTRKPVWSPVTPKLHQGHNASSTANQLFLTMRELSKTRHQLRDSTRTKLDIHIIKPDPELVKLYTGLTCYSKFQTLFEFLRPDIESPLPLQTPYTSRPTLQFQRISPENCLLLTLVKLKLNLLQDDIAFRFGIDQSYVSTVITVFTDLMYRRFREVPIWPTQKDVRESMPEAFKTEYSRTRVIIDCTELFIQRPTSTTVQQLTYSTYKSHNTAKALIGITPNRFISFLPDIQPGRLSDKEVVSRSGLIDLLDSDDMVMADRGFLIDELLKENQVLNIPPFLKSRPQFDKEEVDETRSIASVRIHVERVIGRVRRYSILNAVHPNNSLVHLNKIWIICCYLTNLAYPEFD